MSDFLGFAIDKGDLDRLTAKLGKLAPAAIDAGADEFHKYLVNVMQIYASYRYVTRSSAYGFPWFSDKQRRKVMAMIRSGEITPGAPRRTQALRGGWRTIGGGINAITVNEVAHATLVQGNKSEQSRHSKKIGWKGIDVVLKERAGELQRKFSGGVKRAIRKLGLQ